MSNATQPTIKVPNHILEISKKETAAHLAVYGAKTKRQLADARKLSRGLAGSTTSAIFDYVNGDQAKYNQIKDAILKSRA